MTDLAGLASTSRRPRHPIGARLSSPRFFDQRRHLGVRTCKCPGEYLPVPPRVQRGLPSTITVDNGTEFTSKALDHWAYRNRLELDYTRPGKPTDTGFIQSFNARVRSACLSQHYFSSVEDARAVLIAWREDYNHQRPHGVLGQRTPAEVGAQAREAVTQESKAIAIVAPGASSEAGLSPNKVEVTEAPERLALRRA